MNTLQYRKEQSQLDAKQISGALSLDDAKMQPNRSSPLLLK